MRKLKLFAVMSLFLAASAAQAQVVSLNDYLELVAQNNTELQSVQANIDAVKGKLAEIQRVYSYTLNAGVNYINDQSGRPYSQLAKLDRMENLGYDVSVDKEFATGTQLSLGLNGSFGKYNYRFGGVDYEVNDIAPFVRLEQSLLKDINGGSTKAGISQAMASAKSALYLLEYQKQGIVLNAKLAYWNLSYARTVVDFRKLSLERTKKIQDWNQRRYNLDLAEKTDLLQSQAAVKVRELNLKLAYEDEAKSQRTFNQILNISDDTKIYEVEKFMDKFNEEGKSYEKKGKSLEKKGTRSDVLSAMEDVQSAMYQQIASQKGMGSDLVFTGEYALNGLDEKFDKATENIGDNKPTYTVGLRYTLPLDFKLRKTINTGYESAKMSAQKAAEFAMVKEKNDWAQLVDDWNNAKSRLDLAMEIEKIQQQRNNEDQSLLKKGRSTTYLVLQSEQDLDDATLSVLQGILELISIYEQADAFYNTNSDLMI